MLVDRDGIVATYTKTRLVPFGEYIPFRQQLGWLTRISKAAPSNMIPGDGARVMTATLRDGRPLKLGVLICFEAAFPDMSRADTRHGAQLIVRVHATSVFANCPRYIHRMQLVERSRFTPRVGHEPPIPDWKRRDWARGVLAAGDPANDV